MSPNPSPLSPPCLSLKHVPDTPYPLSLLFFRRTRVIFPLKFVLLSLFKWDRGKYIFEELSMFFQRERLMWTISVESSAISVFPKLPFQNGEIRFANFEKFFTIRLTRTYSSYWSFSWFNQNYLIILSQWARDISILPSNLTSFLWRSSLSL